MKKVINLIALTLILNGCASNIKKSKIVYLFPPETERVINEFLLKNKEKIASFYFEKNENKMSTKIHIEFFSDSNEMSRLSNNSFKSNRFAFIDQKYYPILFDYDDSFYSITKEGKPQVVIVDESTKEENEKDIPSLDFRLKNPHLIGYKKSLKIIDWSNYLIIDDKGNIIENGLK